jgi:Membrane domain of glycerophosphoryl diester phosphodiesterase
MAPPDKGGAFDVSRVISRTFGLIGRNGAPFSFLSALFSGVPYLVAALSVPATISVTGGAGAEFMPMAVLGYSAIYMLGAMVLQASLTRASVDELAGGRVSLGASLRAGLAALLPMLGLLLFFFFLFVVAMFAVGIIAGIAALGAVYVLILVFYGVLIVTLVYLFVRWIAVVPVVVIERPGVIESLRRSSDLTENHRWAILGLIVLYAAAMVVLQAVLAAVLPGPGPDFAATSSSALAVIAVGFIVQVATSMIVAVGIAAIYFELRQIKEGVGVTELAQVFA